MRRLENKVGHALFHRAPGHITLNRQAGNSCPPLSVPSPTSPTAWPRPEGSVRGGSAAYGLTSRRPSH
ncbi:hypothetical protein [Streptomyces sp. Pv4-95]|uniref:hypothetical protein n=1 Tax=Streptomyces sp. Pv4-95 TaxID=3049543 RepID=UPI003892319F